MILLIIDMNSKNNLSSKNGRQDFSIAAHIVSLCCIVVLFV